MTKKNFKIIKDPEYGYLRVSPIPAQKEVEKYYREEYHKNTFQCDDSSLQVQRQEKDFYQAQRENILKNIKKHFSRIGGLKLLDIGCGFGLALNYYQKKGLKVYGLEPTIEGADYSKKQGLNIFQGSIEDFNVFKKQKFDVVTMINVLEHLRKPAEILKKIKKELLKPNGLLIIDVPNEFNDFQVVADKEYKLGQWWVCPPNHINYFSASSLTNLLQKIGYKVIYKESSFPLEIFLLMGDVYAGDKNLGKICHRKRVKFEHLLRKHGKEDKLNKFYQSLAELDLGRQVIVYAQGN